MRNMFFVLSLLFSVAAHASIENIMGLLHKQDNQYFMKLSEGDRKFKLLSASADTQQNLIKLTDGDLVTGTGTIDTEKFEIQLHTIDYVGIKRFLGTWHSAEGMFEITSFERMNFYPYAIPANNQIPKKDVGRIAPLVYKYSMTPSQGREWVMFMSDAKSTVFATIQIAEDKARLKIYDSETGQLTKSLRLTKWRLF